MGGAVDGTQGLQAENAATVNGDAAGGCRVVGACENQGTVFDGGGSRVGVVSGEQQGAVSVLAEATRAADDGGDAQVAGG